jgi:hypothetical protein
MRTRNAVGTYGFTNLLLNPVRGLSIMWKGPPAAEAGRADIAAVQAGEARKVSCFLRGSSDPFPRRLKQGVLYISAPEAHWVPFWSLRRPRLPITIGARSVRTRPADYREPNVKQGGIALHGVEVPVFMVVTRTTDTSDADETVDFVVPAADAPLVASYLGGALTR